MGQLRGGDGALDGDGLRQGCRSRCPVAEQQGRLGDAATADGLEPVDPAEWMPFYEAYARGGRFEDANRIGSLLRDAYPALDQYCLKFPAIPDEQVSSVDDYLTANLCSEFWSRRAD